MPNVFDVGALTIGKLKNNVEALLIRKAAEEPKRIFDYSIAYEIAKNAVVGKKDEKKGLEADTPNTGCLNTLHM